MKQKKQTKEKAKNKKTAKRGIGKAPKNISWLFLAFQKKASGKLKNKGKNNFFAKKSLEDCLDSLQINKKDLGKVYIWSLRFFKVRNFIKKFLKKFFLVGFKASYRLFIVAVVLMVVCSVSPNALSAPKSTTITSKAEWDLGQFSGVTSENSTDSIQLSPSGSWIARTWAPPEDVVSYGHSSVMIGNYLYIFRGYSGSAFWRYDTTKNTWSNLASLPQPAFYGADLTYNENSGKIYAIFGGYSQRFYSYDIENDEWTRLGDLLDTPYIGASIESDGNSLFVIRGNSTTDFWKYDINTGVWSNRAPTTLAVSQGSSLVNGQDGNFYLVRGAGTLNFYRYNISANRWYTTADAAYGGAALASITSGYTFGSASTGEQKGVYWNGELYFLQSNATVNFLKYTLATNAWTVLSTDPAPQAVSYGSLTYNSNDGYIYAFRANGTTDFWKYDPDGAAGQRWIGPKQVQNTAGTLQNVGTGGDLVWNQNYGGNNYIYAVQGGNTTGLYVYNKTAGTWTTGTVLPIATNIDAKGVINSSNGYLYYPRPGSANILTYTGGTAGTWANMSPVPPATPSNGAGLAFVGTNLYYIPGGASQNMYRYNGTSWSAAIPMSITSGATTTYYANVGARIISDGTDIYVILGDGETTFLKYTVSGGTWSTLASTPFSQYYGDDLTYDSANGKIYALAGNYKNETWEYTISSNTWRRLPDNQKYTFDRGPYNGAAIEYSGSSSLYATTGQSLPDMWSYSVPATNFPTSGTYTYNSHQIDLGQISSGTSFAFTETKPANTTTKYEICTNSDGLTCSSWHDVTDGIINDLTLYRYAWVRITLSSSDGASTPTVSDYTISYASSDTPPSVPQGLNAKSDQGGTAIVSGNQYTFESPYFSWSPGSDNGSGIAGYYVYFGKDSNADPASSGTYQTTSVYSVNTAMSYDTDPVHNYGTYYLIIKAKDNNGLISDAWSPFTYLYKGVSPSQSITKTSQGDFNSAGADFDSGKVSYSAVDGSMRLSNVSGFWNQARLSASTYYTYVGNKLAAGGCKSGSALSGNHCLYAFQGNNQTVFMRYEIETDTWITSPTNLAVAPAGINNGGGLVEGPSGYLYAVRGVSTSTFWKYDIVNNAWSQLDDMPKAVTYGSVLVYDNSRYIYAMPGNDDATYRYDTCNGEGGDCTPEWIQLANANFGNPNTADGQRTYEGADGVYDGRNNMYVLQGNYYPYFSKYSMNDDSGFGEVGNTWTPLSAAPVGFYDGANISFDGDHTIYVLAGTSRMRFFKYDINTDTWSSLPDAPATISYGSSSVFYNGYLYITRGGTYTTFYRFNTTNNTWEIPNRNIFGTSNVTGSVYFPFTNGASMTSDNSGNVYLERGGFDNVFGKYETSSGAFTKLSKLPVGAYNGSNIIYNGSENDIYYVGGNGIRTRRSGADTKNPYFFKYDIPSNVWSQITTDLPPAQVYLGSSMTYDGSRYIYMTQGNGATTWWRYDTQGSAGSRWSAMSTTGSCASGDGSKILYVDGTIYRIQGGGSTTNCKFSVSGGTWTTMGVLPGTASSGASLMNGGDGYVYVTRGGNTNNYYRYSTSQSGAGSWENLSSTNVPAQVTTGGWGTNVNNRNWATAGAGGGTTFPDGIYSYVVSSSSNGTGFEKTGTYTSESINLTQAYRFANLTAKYTLPSNTSLEIQTRTSSNGSTWGSWSTVSDDHASGDSHVFSINSEPEAYIQIKMIFSSSDQIYSPKVDDFSINYYQDITAPSNPTEVSAYDTSLKANPLTSNTWYNYATPYFEWPEVDTAGGAADNQGGSGIAGYYVYFGTDQNADPVNFQTGRTYSASSLTSGQTYYLKIQAVDNAGMLPIESLAAFTYKLDSTAPTNPSDITVSPTGYSSASEYTFTWENNVADSNSGVLKFQYKTGDPVDTWHDILDPSTVSQVAAPYQSNKNTFYLRAVDNAGNASTPITMDYFWSGGAASPPTNLAVTPDSEGNITNQFTFTWDLPTSFAGDASKLTYYYSVNYLPTPFNTIETTGRSAGPGPFATQYGKNTFYIVAMSEGGSKTNINDVDWDNPARVDFYAKTTAPGPPVNNQIFDTSDRESQEYSVAVKWSPPLSYDSGNFSGYTIYRSTDGSNFVEVATTTGSAYVDTELESRLYYYYVRSRDKTNNLSTPTSTLSITPTGRYTTAPTIVTEPSVTVESFAATITWSTNRVASSFVEYGTSVSLGKTNGQVDSVTAHTVALEGLEAATKYYYKAKYIDPDGNIGTSEIGNFTTNDPPTISDVVTSEIGLDTATVSWSTNMSGTCTLKYGKGSFTNSIEESAGGTTHIQKLSSLENSTSYLYQIECLDADSNSFNSDQYTFTTLEQARVENLAVQNKENVDIPTIELTYTTTHEASTLVKFKGENEGSYHNYLVNDLSLEHSATIEGLDPAIEYEIIATGIDANGIEAASMTAEVTTLTDSRPPGVTTNRAVGKVIGRGKEARANLYVKIETDELTTTRILFGKGTILSNFEQSTSVDPLNTYHLVTIPVDPGQVYSYVVEAIDEADNKTTTNPATVVVESSKEDATEIVVNTFANKFGWIAKLWSR